jgi:glutamine synthetase
MTYVLQLGFFEGINQEVACGQWDFNCLHKEQKKQVTKWVARYLLDRLTEKYGYYIEYHPKPGDTD